jgi:hypothetical protein
LVASLTKFYFLFVAATQRVQYLDSASVVLGALAGMADTPAAPLPRGSYFTEARIREIPRTSALPNSRKFAKDSSLIHRHLLVCRNNDVKDQSALRVDRGLRPISDDLTSGLPAGYHLDLLSDPCVIILRRPGESIVARFTLFADPKEIRRAAEEDRARLEADPDG